MAKKTDYSSRAMIIAIVILVVLEVVTYIKYSKLQTAVATFITEIESAKDQESINAIFTQFKQTTGPLVSSSKSSAMALPSQSRTPIFQLGTVEGGSCGIRGNCLGNLECVNNKCMAKGNAGTQCTSDLSSGTTTCTSGLVCNSGVCGPAQACTSLNSECPSKQVCNIPEHKCVAAKGCTPTSQPSQCTETIGGHPTVCSSTGVCIISDRYESKCSGDSDCSNGQYCNTANPRACAAGCVSNQNCTKSMPTCRNHQCVAGSG